MAAALVPLAALAFLFSYSDHLSRAEEEHAHFVDYARLIGQSSSKVLAQTEGYAAALTARSPSAFADCRALFETVRSELTHAIELTVTSGGRGLCFVALSNDTPVLVPDAANVAASALRVSRNNPQSGLRVEIGLRPESLLVAPIAATISSDIGFALLGEDGTILASYTADLEEKQAFLDVLDSLDLTNSLDQTIFRTADDWLFAAVALPGTQFRILTGARSVDGLMEPWLSIAKALAPPLLLLAVVFVVLRYGIQRFLLRYLRHIYATFRRYGAGDTAARVGMLKSAPPEINILGMTFDMMADRIDTRTKDLEASLAEQRRLTRELHHRIKNTLQMISSLLAMQRRDSKRESEQAVLRVALERVLSISAAYRISYASNEGTDVAVEALVREVVESLREPAMVSRNAIHIHADEGADTTIDLDRAIPLAFILAELLPNRFDRLQPGETLSIEVQGGGSIVVLISGGGRAGNISEITDDSDSLLRSRLVRAYLGQLSATFSTEDDVLRLEMPDLGLPRSATQPQAT